MSEEQKSEAEIITELKYIRRDLDRSRQEIDECKRSIKQEVQSLRDDLKRDYVQISRYITTERLVQGFVALVLMAVVFGMLALLGLKA